jgi:hypothetical protein
MFRLEVEATGGVTITSPGIMIQTDGPAMKAIQMHGYGGVDQLRYEDALSPTAGPVEVLVKIAATSVSNRLEDRPRKHEGNDDYSVSRHSGARRCR